MQSFGLQKSEVSADRNCLFTSLILYLTNVFDDNKESKLIDYLNSINITRESCIVQLLRNMLVDEWMLNQQNYKPFCENASIDFEQEAEQYYSYIPYGRKFLKDLILILKIVKHF